MNSAARLEEARRIMVAFAEQTGLTGERNPPRRYLWTDAHAVCNFLSLFRRTNDDQFKRLALDLVDQVHNMLGKHRDDDPRRGWISGLSENEGAKHPTAGGLRIGKKLTERSAREPFNERLEWDRDGQYFHYLTKWMHALCRVAAETQDSRYWIWAVELAQTAHAGFSAAWLPGGKKGLYWKMSIDLSRPQIPSAGLHDPLDGYITYQEIGLCAQPFLNEIGDHILNDEIDDAATLIQAQHWSTSDPLGIGGLLFDCCRVSQLIVGGQLETTELLEALIGDAQRSLVAFTRELPLNHPPEHRLAFRELGLSIGLQAILKLEAVFDGKPNLFLGHVKTGLQNLNQFVPLGDALERFWRDSRNWRVPSWMDHQDINMVTLATSLVPDEFLSVSANS